MTRRRLRTGLPSGPLLVFMRRVGYDTGPRAVARILGCDPKTVTAWVKRGTPISTWKADQFARRLGVSHPCEVWGDRWWSHTPTVDTDHNYLAFPHFRDPSTDDPWLDGLDPPVEASA